MRNTLSLLGLSIYLGIIRSCYPYTLRTVYFSSLDKHIAVFLIAARTSRLRATTDAQELRGYGISLPRVSCSRFTGVHKPESFRNSCCESPSK
ncbi:hypothetical protein CY34DRAFT_531036 [Suillus luteus UH-Slu-Lm8-n1]|uniref:Uncharacterized protein n=1 Tax=Suillus luteus UH-Slu-Lm8-n1 TaxID=930992 RepID=A0A0D0AV51_9AGAM|nr:hypothetical protein CY34DRAFT_531036 [Suillus luteus UH-Slu-Lm8-n1]